MTVNDISFILLTFRFKLSHSEDMSVIEFRGPKKFFAFGLIISMRHMKQVFVMWYISNMITIIWNNMIYSNIFKNACSCNYVWHVTHNLMLKNMHAQMYVTHGAWHKGSYEPPYINMSWIQTIISCNILYENAMTD